MSSRDHKHYGYWWEVEGSYILLCLLASFPEMSAFCVYATSTVLCGILEFHLFMAGFQEVTSKES